jgi:hypothetical protein
MVPLCATLCHLRRPRRKATSPRSVGLAIAEATFFGAGGSEDFGPRLEPPHIDDFGALTESTEVGVQAIEMHRTGFVRRERSARRPSRWV